MSLSKVYKTSEVVFEPEDLVQDSVREVPVAKTKVPEPLTQEEIHKDMAPVAPPPPEPEPAPAAPPPDPGIPEKEVERLIAEARQQGMIEGIQKAEADYGSAVAAMQLVCGQLEELRELILKNSTVEMRDLVIDIAEKIIRHSVTEQSHTVIRTVDEAISKAVKSDAFQIFVNPDDHAVISEKSEELISGLTGLSNIAFKADPSVDRGGCRVEADTCTVDATIASQLQIVREALEHEQDEPGQ